MLNGIDPIIIFNFKAIPPAPLEKLDVPLFPSLDTLISLPAIPIYLSERVTGILIDSEEKNIDVDTTTTTFVDGSAPKTNQRAISSVVTINMKAAQGSLGVALFSAMADLIFPKLTSKEYSITYLHGAVTVFQGLLHSFSINQNAGDTLYNISLGLIKPAPEKKTTVEVPRFNDGLALTVPVV